MRAYHRVIRYNRAFEGELQLEGIDQSLLPDGVELCPLQPHADHRGTFTEMFRDEWDTGIHPVQWNVVSSGAHVLRGVHAHRLHADYLTCVSGRMLAGLCDLRPHSPTFRLAATVELTPARMSAVMIPPGVAHGFYFPEPSIHVYAVSRYWDPEDELGCRWDDPALGLPWAVQNPVLSERDERLPSLADLMRKLEL